mmetsp:Transcript_22492/g.32209  ORF Transcript_22492/g.32209 Transcript_22492/m.32209 type:complete len:185 (+) Transcript_22492:213-767(+)
MEQFVLEEVLRDVTSLFTWECSLHKAVDNASPGGLWSGTNEQTGAVTSEEEKAEMMIMYDHWGHPFVPGEPIKAAVDNNVKSAAAPNNDFHLHQHVSRSCNNDSTNEDVSISCNNNSTNEDGVISGNNDSINDAGCSLQYNDFKEMFDTLHGLSSDSRQEKIWLRERLQSLIHDRLAAKVDAVS